MLKTTILLALITVALSHENDVHTIKYNTDNFDEEVAKTNHFVMFYAPWCGHCQRLAATWEQLAEMLNEDDSNIKIAKVDCTSDPEVCSSQDITGYPTLKFFTPDVKEAVKFRGTRDLPTLTTFINEQLSLARGDSVDGIVKPINGLLELTEDNFEEHLSKGKHFVKFYAPWCGHCQKLAPIWEQLAKSLEFEGAVSIGKVDCTQYRAICNLYDIKGYPSLLWIENGKKMDKYQGERTHEDLKSYVNRLIGSSADGLPKPEEKIESEEGIKVLNGDNFKESIENGVAFVKFFAPWCGHCKRLAPTWEDLARKFLGNNSVQIVKIDCTLEGNKELCNSEEVEGFPSIFLYKNGQKISEYSGTRSLDDMYDFVLKHTGHDEL